MKNLIYGFALLLMLVGAYSLPAEAAIGESQHSHFVKKEGIASSYVSMAVDVDKDIRIGFSDGVLPDGLFIPSPDTDYRYALMNYARKEKRMERQLIQVLNSQLSEKGLQRIQSLSSESITG